MGKAINNSVLLQCSCSLLVFLLCRAVDAYVPALQCDDVDDDGDSCLLTCLSQCPFSSQYCLGCKASDLARFRGFEFDMLPRDVQHTAYGICRCVVAAIKSAAALSTSYSMWLQLLWRTDCQKTVATSHSLWAC